jgi:hypothetical protein
VYAQHTSASWLAAHPGIGSMNDDAEGDGRTNFMEFALQTDPLVPNAGEPPVATIENGRQTLTFTRLTPPSAVTYEPQLSEDLAVWRAPNPGEITQEILATDGFTQTVKLTDTMAVSAGAPRYLRLKMSAVP